jgi:hypothetical protein
MTATNLSTKAENLNLFLLANSVGTILCLQVNLWIPKI